MHSERIEHLREMMLVRRLDGILVTNPHHIFYLTGLSQFVSHPRDAYLYIGGKKNYFFTNRLYAGGIENSSLFEIVIISGNNPFPNALANIVRHVKYKRTGVPIREISHYEYGQFAKSLNVELAACDGMIEEIRMMKDSFEIDAIRSACRLTDQTFTSLLKHLRAGLSENDIARFIENYIRDHGGSLAFPPIVALDAHAAVPHHSPQETHLSQNTTLMLVDMGAQLNGYCSDLTRVIFSTPPTSFLKSVYSSLRHVQTETISHINSLPPSSPFSDISKFCNRLMKKHKLPEMPHSLGHGLGVEVHEAPNIHSRSSENLLENMVFTIEPGVYVDGKYGMRVEDTVCYTPKGLESLTQSPSEIIVKSI